jgi:hypothetical protein
MIAANMPTRREFLFGAAAGVGVMTLGCRKELEAILKIPEDAEECLHLFKFFTDPNFDFEQARTGLSLTGKPQVLQSTPTWRRHTFNAQTSAAGSVTLDTTTKDDGPGEYLSAIYIDYRRPPGISLSTMKSNFGAATEHSEKVLVDDGYSPAQFTNMMRKKKEKEVISYSFFPEPIAPGYMKGDVLFRCDATYWDTKTVDFLRLQRHPV